MNLRGVQAEYFNLNVTFVIRTLSEAMALYKFLYECLLCQ
jgi:hypothetical protein